MNATIDRRAPRSNGTLAGHVVAFLERRHPPGYEGAVAGLLVPHLRAAGARVDIVHAEEGAHRLDAPFPWSLVVLKSGSAAALHLAAAAEAWGVPCVNTSEATRLAQDKLAGAATLRGAGLPVPASYLAWLGPGRPTEGQRGAPLLAGGDAPAAPAAPSDAPVVRLEDLAAGTWVVKAARGSRGEGLWRAGPGELPALAETLPAGPYLLMEHVPHQGDDLKVYVAGDWTAAIARPFPATTLGAKRGRPAALPAEAADATRAAGRQLGLTCYGCDFIRGPSGWVLVDVNAFPGYKGADGAPLALAAEIGRAAGAAGGGDGP